MSNLGDIGKSFEQKVSEANLGGKPEPTDMEQFYKAEWELAKDQLAAQSKDLAEAKDKLDASREMEKQAWEHSDALRDAYEKKIARYEEKLNKLGEECAIHEEGANLLRKDLAAAEAEIQQALEEYAAGKVMEFSKRIWERGKGPGSLRQILDEEIDSILAGLKRGE